MLADLARASERLCLGRGHSQHGLRAERAANGMGPHRRAALCQYDRALEGGNGDPLWIVNTRPDPSTPE